MIEITCTKCGKSREIKPDVLVDLRCLTEKCDSQKAFFSVPVIRQSHGEEVWTKVAENDVVSVGEKQATSYNYLWKVKPYTRLLVRSEAKLETKIEPKIEVKVEEVKEEPKKKLGRPKGSFKR
jgi:hypothetical protein